MTDDQRHATIITGLPQQPKEKGFESGRIPTQYKLRIARAILRELHNRINRDSPRNPDQDA